MTKNSELQKELLEKVKPGVKASDIKRLKRSKSADDIANTPTSNPPLKKSQSQLEIPVVQQLSQDQQITQLQEQVKFHAETAQNYLTSLQTSQAKVSELEEKIKKNPPNPLLQEQLKAKQQEVEELRKKLEQKNTELTETTQQLDNSLFARVAAVKQFGLIYDKLSQISKELDDTVEQASDELVKGDDKNSQLRTKLLTARQQITSLQKDLNLAQRLAELRKVPLPNNESNWDYLKPALYSLCTITLTIWLLRTNN